MSVNARSKFNELVQQGAIPCSAEPVVEKSGNIFIATSRYEGKEYKAEAQRKALASELALSKLISELKIKPKNSVKHARRAFLESGGTIKTRMEQTIEGVKATVTLSAPDNTVIVSTITAPDFNAYGLEIKRTIERSFPNFKSD